MKEIFALIVLFLLSAFFSMAETAITTVSKGKIRHFVGQKFSGAKALEALRVNPSRFLSTILVSNNLVNVAAAALTTSIIIEMLHQAGWGSTGIAIGIATGLVTFLLLIFF